MVGSGFPKRIGGTKSESPRQRNLAPDRERRVSGMCFGGLTLLVEASADHPPHALLPENCWLSLAAGCPPHGFFRQEGPANPSGRPKQRHAPTSAFTPEAVVICFRLQMQLLHKKSLICTKTLGSIGAMTSASQRSGLEFRFERSVSLGLKSFIARLDELRTGVAL